MMKGMKLVVTFIHAADIHLDSPLKGLERYEGAPTHLQNATRQAFDNLIKLALDEEVDFLLIAGDLYDGDWRDYNTGLYFATRMNQLREANIPVFIVRGNHDAASQITRHLSLPENVVDFSSDKPETKLLENLGVAIHGQGFRQRATTTNLAQGYPEPKLGYFNIGLLHTALDGRVGHEPYAPCSLQDLVNKGYDYWALGHVHRQEIVQQEPLIIYPGNLQGRHINETGAKGCTVVTLNNGKVDKLRHVDLDVLRWSKTKINCAELSSPDDILDQIRLQIARKLEIADGRVLAFRFELEGATLAHQALHRDRERWINEIRLVVQEVAGDDGWLESVKIRTSSRRDISKLAQDHLPIGFLLNYFAEIEKDPELLNEIKGEFQTLKSRLPSELLLDYPELNLENSAVLQEMLHAAKTIVELALSEEVAPDEN